MLIIGREDSNCLQQAHAASRIGAQLVSVIPYHHVSCQRLYGVKTSLELVLQLSCSAEEPTKVALQQRLACASVRSLISTLYTATLGNIACTLHHQRQSQYIPVW